MKPVRCGRRFFRNTDGAAAIEFSLVIGALLLLLISTIEVARFMWTAQALEDAAIVGARCLGILGPDCANGDAVEPAQATAFIQQAALSRGVALAPESISLALDEGCALETGFMRVGLTVSFDSVVPGLTGKTVAAEACFPAAIDR